MRPGAVAALVGVILLAQGASVTRREADRAASSKVAVDSGLASWVGAHIRPRDALLIVGDAQRLGYRLERPTVGVPSQQFTARSWDSLEVLDAIERYRVRAVIITQDRKATSYGPFLDRLIAGETPAWLIPALTTGQVRVYRSQVGTRAKQN